MATKKRKKIKSKLAGSSRPSPPKNKKKGKK